MIEYLSLEDVLTLVDDLGVGRLRDVGLLDSAVHRPRVTVFGRDAYSGLDTKAAVLLESVVDTPTHAAAQPFVVESLTRGSGQHVFLVPTAGVFA